MQGFTTHLNSSLIQIKSLMQGNSSSLFFTVCIGNKTIFLNGWFYQRFILTLLVTN